MLREPIKILLYNWNLSSLFSWPFSLILILLLSYSGTLETINGWIFWLIFAKEVWWWDIIAILIVIAFFFILYTLDKEGIEKLESYFVKKKGKKASEKAEEAKEEAQKPASRKESEEEVTGREFIERVGKKLEEDEEDEDLESPKFRE